MKISVSLSLHLAAFPFPLDPEHWTEGKQTEFLNPQLPYIDLPENSNYCITILQMKETQDETLLY